MNRARGCNRMEVPAEAQDETWHGIYAVFQELGAYLGHLARHSRFDRIDPAERAGNESPPHTGGRAGGNS